MRANPGGEIAPSNVIGRDRLIQRLWETLDEQSVVLVAERRIGKSCVVKKMRAEQPAGMLAFYRDVEGIDSPLGFVERVYQDVTVHLTRLKRSAGRARALLKQLAEAEIGGFKLPSSVAPHWVAVLERTIEDLLDCQDRTIVLFWDELPLMLLKIRRMSGEATAMELLDTLRALRQTHARLRMVYTGSIGLHHLAAALRHAGHANDATNDMRTVEVPPLADHDARFLAAELLRGERLAAPDLDGTAAAIASAVDGIPYYIHHVVSLMKDRGGTASAELAQSIVAEALVDAQDPWHLQHYRDRLRDYYGQERLPIVTALLDALAAAADPLTLDELQRQAGGDPSSQGQTTVAELMHDDREAFRQVVDLVERDHYARQDADGRHRFRFSLVQRWWRQKRGLV